MEFKHFINKYSNMKLNLYLSFLLILCVGMVNAQVLTEDFEGGLPGDWSADGGWQHGTSASVSSQYFNPPAHTQFMAVNDDGAGSGVNTSGRVVTPEIDLSSITSPFVRVSVYFVDGDYQGADERATVQVSNDGGATWTEMFDFPGASAWTEYFVSLTQFAGEKVIIAFDYDDGGGWNFGYCIDDIEVVNYEVKSNAALLDVVSDCSAAVPGVSTALSASMFNYAVDTVTSFDVHITGNGVDETISITDVEVPPFTGISFDLGYEYEVSNEDAMLTLNITNLSTGDDEDTMDNELDLAITSVDAKPGRAAVVEEATGTWCTWCPRGAVFMERAEHCFGDAFVGIAVHNNDPMAVSEYDNGVTSFPNFTGFPSVLFNRTQVLDPSAIFDPIVAYVEQNATIEVGGTVSWDSTARTIDVEASATFLFDAVSGYRFNAVIVEDGVTGTTSGYNQVNAYSGGNFGAMGGYENLPDPVPASMMVYDIVGRALLGGFDGAPGSIGTVQNGGTATFTFDTYTVPANFDANNLSVVIFVLDPQGRIVNGTQLDLEETSNTFFVGQNEVNWNVAPNPFSSQATVTVDLPKTGDINIMMVDMLGRIVWSRDFADQYGVNTYPLTRGNIASGVYSVVLTYEGQTAVQKVVVD
jgi:hypothetical protein